ncbi:MAG: hypothetical protein ACR2QQ_08935 [Gammaproteobacteria bacterium]
MILRKLLLSRLTVIVLLASFAASAWAYRVVELVEEAYEVGLEDLDLPARSPGNAVVRPCSGCTAIYLTLDGRTTFFIQDRPTDYATFFELTNEIRDSSSDPSSITFGVFYRPGSAIVTRIKLYEP